jgi:hypothetical protein
MKSLVDAVEGPKKEKKDTYKEKYEERKEFVDYIQEKYWYDLPFERLQKEIDVDVSWEYWWSRVKISKYSKFFGQSDSEGTIIKNDDTPWWFRVNFDDGYNDVYRLSDLIITQKKNDSDNIEKIKKTNDKILKDIAKQGNNDFIDDSVALLFDALQKNEKLMNMMFPNEDFNEWDDIIMNKRANGEYTYSVEGSKWVILKKNSYDFSVRFDYIPGGYSEHPVWEIKPEYMINLSKKADRKITLEDVQKKVSEILRLLKDERESKKDNMGDSKRKELATNLLLQENFLLPGDKKWSYVLNYREMVKFIAPKLYAAYGNKELYSEEDMCAPPSECHPNVLKFELSRGCNYNRCTYCDLYKDVKYCPRTFEEFKVHVDKVMEVLGDYRRKIERLFIGGGNALAMDEKTLLDSLKYANNKLNLRRISMYARTQDINRKWSEWLQKLYHAWLTNLYRWAETWSDEILKYIKKWTTLDDMLKASKNLSKTSINLSVTLMPGIWGKRFDEENIKWTTKFLNSTNTQYITFMAINSSPNSEYDKIMKDEMMAGTNSPLTNVEVVKQIKAILEWLEPKGQKIGMHGPEVHEVDYNPFYFKITFDQRWKKEAINLCDKYLDSHVI